MTLPNITECKECGSTSLSWQTQITTDSGVQQGRLRTNDMKCVFFLGCDSCSETLALVNADQVAQHLNEQREVADVPEHVQMVGYQCRTKTSRPDCVWREWVPCSEEVYNDFVNSPEPNKFGIMREVRKVYAAADGRDVARLRALIDEGQRESEKLLALLADQGQGEPVQLPSVRKNVGPFLADQFNAGWNECLADIAKLGPLYNRADPSEIQRIESQVNMKRTMLGAVLDDWEKVDHEHSVLRAQLAELVSAIRSINFGPAHAIKRPGDDEPYYPQRKEWVEWVLALCDAAGAIDAGNCTFCKDESSIKWPSSPEGHCARCAIMTSMGASSDSEKEAVQRTEEVGFEQAFSVPDGIYFSPDHNAYRSMNGRSIEQTDASDFTLRREGWMARAVLEQKP